MYTVIITRKSADFPNYYTYTAHEFLTLSEEYLRVIASVMIVERMSDKKLRKIRNRMNAFNIVEIDMLPEDVIDVAENSTVYLQNSNVHVNVRIPSHEDLQSLNDEVLVTLGNEVKKLMDITSYSPDSKMSYELMSGLSQFFNRLGNYNTEGLRREVMARAVRQFKTHDDIAKAITRARDKLIDASAFRQSMQRVGRVIPLYGCTAGEERVVKPKAFLHDPSPVRYFKTKQGLAEHLASMLPETVDIRKRNALKFKVCCELGETELLKLATDLQHQQAFINKYC